MRIALIVNGTAHEISAPPNTPLLDACMVLVDGEPVYACTREIGTLAGAQITTVEALDGHLLRAAFLAEQAASAAIVFPAS
jgi:nicotinate dehydrogenase subunit A